MMVATKKVYVGLSGGVDSAVSAALLKRAGANVTGVFIKGWYPPGLPCTWAADRRDAMRVAAALHIPFLTLDASTAYKEGVIDYLLAEYRAGRTPNPDIMCNREIKFGVFYRFAKEHGIDLIATGHYARRGTRQEGVLRRGADPAKDQSYFLWAVPKETIVETIFPIGEFRKEKVRAHARALNLPVAAKKDSQGICFLGSISVEDFLRSEFGEAPGRAIDALGNEIGTHNGVLLHTLGERVALVDATSGPWYVLAKDIVRNEMIVGKERLVPAPAQSMGIAYREANWFLDPSNATEAEIRYHGTRIPGQMKDGKFSPHGAVPEPPVPGQSIVFYNGDIVVGGGIISA